MKKQLEQILEQIKKEKAFSEKMMEIDVSKIDTNVYPYLLGRDNAFTFCIYKLEEILKANEQD